jgi:hypothetical protein
VAHQFKVKRKDGKGYWVLPHMDQDQIDALTGGEDTDLHTHDQRYYTETEIDANIYTKTEVDVLFTTHIAADDHTIYSLIDGTRAFTGAVDIIRNANDALTNLILSNLNTGSLNQTYIRCEAQNNSISMASFSDAYGAPFGNAGAIYTGAGQNLLLGTEGGWNVRIDTSGVVYIPGGITLDDVLTIDSILDQDDFYSDSDTALATQQSIKAYVDTEIGNIDLSAYLKHDGTVALSADWDVGTFLIKSDEIRSRLGTNTGLKLSNRGNTGFIFIEDGSEHVGINVANPDKVLDVYQSAGSVIAQFTTGAANCFLEFLDSSTGSNKVYLG